MTEYAPAEASADVSATEGALPTIDTGMILILAAAAGVGVLVLILLLRKR